MSDKKTSKRVYYVTPVGEARYPWLTQPDTKFSAEGVYKLDLVLGADAAKEHVERIEAEANKQLAAAVAEWKKAAANAKKTGRRQPPEPRIYLPLGHPVGPDDEPTGEVVMKFKLPAQIKAKSGEIIKLRPALFDAKGRPIKGDVKIWTGSRVRVSYYVNPFYSAGTGDAGVQLRLAAVQVIELRTGGSGDASSFGFVEEEGYEHSEEYAGDPELTGEGGTEEAEVDVSAEADF
jgi:hypothetical protein